MSPRFGYQAGDVPASSLKPPPPSVCVRSTPPFQPELDAIRWIEDHAHGPSRSRRPACWLIFWRPCPHQKSGT